MSIAIVTGSSGLIGSEAVAFFSEKGFTVIGIDNNMRSYFFGDKASTLWNRKNVESRWSNYRHYSTDIRDIDGLEKIFSEYGSNVSLIIHTAAQPSHDWAAKEPLTDFSINANGTINLLEQCRKHCPNAVFIFTSTNKVYGDTPNKLPLIELESRWEIDRSHKFYNEGIDESMSIDQSTHSLFGASKIAADILVQEYGRYFGISTASFRGGCLTGSGHSGAELHGFLSYLIQCVVTRNHYTVFGHQGKQVRDNIHSLDLVNAFWSFFQAPRVGEVYNIGGGRASNCSMMEVISHVERISGKQLVWSYSDQARVGDHIWWISDTSKFQRHYPDWKQVFQLEDIIIDIFAGIEARS